MGRNSFGQIFRLTTWGESHGPGVGCVVDGCPAGLAPAAEAARPAPAAPAPATSGAAPCPCCGAMMPLNLRRCTQCNRPMLVHTPPNPEESSRALMLLAFVWMLPVIIDFAVVFFLWGPIVMRGADLLSDGVSRIIALITLAVISLPAILIARGLFLRRRWAFIMAVILLGLKVIFLIQRAMDPVPMVSQSSDIQMLTSSPMIILTLLFLLIDPVAMVLQNGDIQILTSSSMIILVLFFLLASNFLWILFQAFLLYRGSPKVFGRKVRLVHTVGAGLPAEHYTLGLDFKEQGMWYAAMQEWEAACAGDHANVQYLHVLGLAYAQVRQRAKAMATLEQALALAPNDQRLRETYQMVQSLG